MKAPSRPALARGLVLATGLGAGFLFFQPRPEPPPRAAPKPNRPAAPPSAPPPSVSHVSPTIASAPADDEARHLEAFLGELTTRHGFGRERQAVLREILENAPPHAVEALLRATFGDDELNDLTHVLFESLAALAPESALAFAREKHLGAEPPWWHSVIGGLADPRVVATDVLALPPSDARTNFLGHIALRIASTDTDAALDYALRSVPPAERPVAVANAVIGVSRRDPAAGLALALAHERDTGDAGLVRSLAVDWAMDDYAAARSHILAMPEGAQKQSALAGLAAVAAGRESPATNP